MQPEVLLQLEGPALRSLLPGFLASQVEAGDRARVAAHIAHWSDADFDGLLRDLRVIGQEHRLYPAIPRCRELARTWMRDVIEPSVTGAEHLVSAMSRGRTVIVTNHLSYLDATATDTLLAWAGHADLADRIAYLAGPKVYQELFRRVAAASIHTVPVPQSTQLGHTEALSARELARRALTSLEAGQNALEQGLALLFYPEGSRTRSGHLEPFLKATHRYLRTAEFVVPAAIDGTDRVMSLDRSTLVPGPVSLVFGAPIPLDHEGSDEPSASAAGARDRANGKDVLAQAHEVIGTLLPPGKRPLPGSAALH